MTAQRRLQKHETKRKRLGRDNKIWVRIPRKTWKALWRVEIMDRFNRIALGVEKIKGDV